MARGTPQAGLRGLGLAGLCEFGTVGQQRRPRWIFANLCLRQTPKLHLSAQTGGGERGRRRHRTQPPLRPTTEEEEEEEEERGRRGRWGVAPLWVKEEEEKERGPLVLTVFANLRGVSISLSGTKGKCYR